MIYEKFDITGKRILITGGGQGIGKIVSRILASCGALIGILDLNGDAADQTARLIGESAYAITCDVTDPVQVGKAMESFVNHFGGIDAVFNNAGIVTHKPAEEVTAEEFSKVINVNLNGVFYIAHGCLRFKIGS